LSVSFTAKISCVFLIAAAACNNKNIIFNGCINKKVRTAQKVVRLNSTTYFWGEKWEQHSKKYVMAALAHHMTYITYLLLALWVNIGDRQTCSKVRFEVLTAAVMKSSIFSDIRLCSPLKVNQRFRGNMFLG
jgi:hypothetical protein